MKKHLFFKMFLSYLAVLLLAGVILMASLQAILPRAFERHMGGVTAGGMHGAGNGQRLGYQSGAPPFYDEFRAGVNDALLGAGSMAILAAAALSWMLSRRIVQPVRQMQRISERIAAGEFEQRVPVTGEDELGQLAQSFNRMAENLAQAEAWRQRLIADVSHELRTPLTAIRGYMEGLQDGVLPADQETFAQIHEESLRLSRLVDDLQRLSRIEAGAYELHIQPVALAEAVQAVQKRLLPLFAEKDLHLDVDVPEDLFVLADDERLMQITTNLLENARRYTPSGGQVSVRARRVDQDVEVCIRDTGIGIALEALPHLFERFYRADSSRSRRRGGSGIGLTIVKHLVMAQGGQVWAESEGPGKGSRFCFRLPAA